jgi:predicted ArsR family transcriptional regulator
MGHMTQGGVGGGGRPQPDNTASRQAKALGDPTRHAIFRAVADSPVPLDIATLTARFELNHNAIRQHLAKLCTAGLVAEEVGPSTGPGRPRLQYRPALDTGGDWGIPSPYEHLAVLLVEALRSGRSPREVGAEAGRQLAATVHGSADPVDRIETIAARRGFEPRRVERRDSIELVLEHCPFQATASDAPEIVCQLHLGLAEGIAEASGGSVEVTELIARNPRRAGCRLRLTRPDGSE